MKADFEPKPSLEKVASALSAGRSVDLTMFNRTRLVLRRRRDYRVYLPAGYDGKQALPLVVVLHGCKQSHLDIQAISGFDPIADREGFIVVYPYITSHSFFRIRNCWGWWLPRERLRDRGEIGDIRQVVGAVVSEFAVDEQRLHVCGLSAGAAMSIVALTAYSDLWKSGASVAGLPYGESARAVRYSRYLPVRYKPMATLNRLLGSALQSDAPDLLVVQSTADKQVGVGAAENLVETWRLSKSLPEQPQTVDSATSHQRSWQFAGYGDGQGRLSLGYLTVDNVEHGWIGGLPGAFSMIPGPNISELIWAFFDKD